MYKLYTLARREALAVLREAKDMEWTFFAPAAEIGPGEKKGKFRVGARNLIADASGHSRISYGDYADAFVTEIEAGRYLKEIATNCRVLNCQPLFRTITHPLAGIL